jgi:hypothetical protein
MANIILPWVVYNEPMLARWLFSLVASSYMIGAIVVLPIWAGTTWHPSLAVWWAAYLVAEAAILSLPIGLVIWWFVWRRHTGGKRLSPSRFVSLVCVALVPVFLLLIVPVGCFVSFRDPVGTIAGASVFLVSAIAFLAMPAYARRIRS